MLSAAVQYSTWSSVGSDGSDQLVSGVAPVDVEPAEDERCRNHQQRQPQELTARPPAASSFRTTGTSARRGRSVPAATDTRRRRPAARRTRCPAISADRVSTFRTITASSGTTPSLKPSRSRSTSNTARWEASSMRPAISAYTIAPTTLRANTQRRAKRYVAPAAGSVTNSPMSTNPPIAVTTPRATAASFCTPAVLPPTPLRRNGLQARQSRV